MYVHLLCGKKQSLYVGNKIFPDLDEFCREHFIDAIQLEPANDSLRRHYESYGFVLTDTYLNRMTKPVHLFLKTSNKTRKIKRT